MNANEIDQNTTLPPINREATASLFVARMGQVAYNWKMILPEGKSARESRWISETAKGNIRSFESLCRAYHHGLYGFIMRMLGCRETTEEVINDVFHGIWNGASRFRNNARPSTWIFSIARNQACKRLANQEPPAIGLDQAPECAGRSDQEQELVRHELVEMALGKLSTEHREVVELTFYSGFSYQEIAEITKVPVNTVKTRMFHARKNLKSILEKAMK